MPSVVSTDGGVILVSLLDCPFECEAVGWARWSSGVWTSLDGIPFYAFDSVSGASDDLSVLVGLVGPGLGVVSAPAAWSAESGVFLELPPSESPSLPSVSADGDVVAGNDGIGPFRWTGDTGITYLMESNDPAARAQVSGDGSVVAGTTGPPRRAYRWTARTGVTFLEPLAEGEPYAAADLSSDGSVVVGNSGPPFTTPPQEAFIWDRANGTRSLPGLLSAVGANPGPVDLVIRETSADGRTFFGYTADFRYWIATLDCPSDDDCDTVRDEDDNCPGLRTTNIHDANNNGIGDMCECGDQTGDGHTNVADILAIMNVIFEQEEASPLCDTNDDDRCNVADVLGVNAKIFGAPAHCARFPSP